MFAVNHRRANQARITHFDHVANRIKFDLYKEGQLVQEHCDAEPSASMFGMLESTAQADVQAALDAQQ